MQKIIKDSNIYFYDNNNIIMSMGFQFDEFIWTFYNNKVISITRDSEMFDLLKYIMKNDYIFENSDLKCTKDAKELIWYSDCYYNPDDEFSKKSVSYLTIKYENDEFNIWCTKPLDMIVDRKQKLHVIAFSSAGNGRYSKNTETESTLQDDIIINVYNKLLEKNKCKRLKYTYDGKE